MRKLVLLLVATILALPAHAAPLTPEDFIRAAAADTLADAEAARLVQADPAIPDQVRELGRQVGTEAAGSGQELARLAEPRNVALANQVTPDDRRVLDRLAGLHGAPLARAWLGYLMVDLDHDQALYRAATGLPDPPVAQFAREILPQLGNRLMVARAVLDAQLAEESR